MEPEQWSSSNASNTGGRSSTIRSGTEVTHSHEEEESQTASIRVNPGMMEEELPGDLDPHDEMMQYCHEQAKKLMVTEYKGGLPRNLLELIYRKLIQAGSMTMFPRFHPYPPTFMTMLDRTRLLVFWNKHFAIISVKTKKVIVIKYLPDLIVSNIGNCIRFKNILIWTSIELTSKDLYFADIYTGKYTLYFRNFTLNPKVTVFDSTLFFSTDDNLFSVKLENINRTLSPRPSGRNSAPKTRTPARSSSFEAKEKFLVSSLHNFAGGGLREISIVESADQCRESLKVTSPAVLMVRVGFPDGLEIVCAPLQATVVEQYVDLSRRALSLDKAQLKTVKCGRISPCYLSLRMHAVSGKLWITFGSVFYLNMIILVNHDPQEMSIVEWRSQSNYGNGFIEEIRPLGTRKNSMQHEFSPAIFFLALNQAGEVVFLANYKTKLYLISTVRPECLFSPQIEKHTRLFASSGSNSNYMVYQEHHGLVTARLSWVADSSVRAHRDTNNLQMMQEEYL